MRAPVRAQQHRRPHEDTGAYALLIPSENGHGVRMQKLKGELCPEAKVIAEKNREEITNDERGATQFSSLEAEVYPPLAAPNATRGDQGLPANVAGSRRAATPARLWRNEPWRLPTPRESRRKKLFLRNEAIWLCAGNVMKSRPKAHWERSGSQPKRTQFAPLRLSLGSHDP